MVKATTFVLSLLSLLALTEAGIIKLLCIDDNGNNVPCEQIAGNSDTWNNWWENGNDKKNTYNSNNNIANAVNPAITNNRQSSNSWISDILRNWLNNNRNNGNNANRPNTNRPNQGTNTKTVPPQNNNRNVPPQNTNTTKNVPTQNNGGGAFNLKELPIQQFTMTGFDGCNQEQTQKLKVLIEDIKTYRAAGKYIIDNQGKDELYKKIFLKYFKDASTLSKVKQVFDNVNNMPTARAYCEKAGSVCNENTLAWTYLYSKEFHVCPIFFTRAMHGTIAKHTSEAASIVLHEMTHCHGTRDYAYGERNIEYLSASQASNNADTYRLYAMRAIYYLNEKVGGLRKREDDDEFLEQTIDFRTEPFEDKVIIRVNENGNNLSKRSNDDFLNEDIDFRSEPFHDAVLERPTN